MTAEDRVFTLISMEDKAAASQYIFDVDLNPDLPTRVIFKAGAEDRTTKQRRLQFFWYRARGEANGNGAKYEEHYCKLTFGVPILRCDSSEFNSFFDAALSRLTYEQQIDAMAFVPVTRFFKVKQNVEYLNDIDQDSANHGWVLPHPEDLYYDSLMKIMPLRK